jgi:nucleotide-binding universal stress UspA family protein
MRDALVHPASDLRATTLACELAARLDLRPVSLPRPGGAPLDAALAVAPVGLRLYRTSRAPVVVLTPAAATVPRLQGTSLICGVQDDDDAACTAIAGALAERLGLSLMLVHVLRRSWTLGFAERSLMPGGIDRTVDELVAGRETVVRVAQAAGLDEPEYLMIRVRGGDAGQTLAAMARRERAAAVVVSASGQRSFRSAGIPSATRYLVRRCERPVIVCPRHPAAALCLREALTGASSPEPRRSWP